MNWKVLLRLLFIALITNSSFLIADEPIPSWYTNMGSLGQDYAEAIAVDDNGNIYVVGWTESTWGTPIEPYSGGQDAFLAKLNSSGERLWHTFMGSPGWDEGIFVAVDGEGNVYVAGTSDASWGTPVHSHTGGNDGFAVKLNSDGERQWHTFVGDLWARARAIAVDTTGNVYVAGMGGVLWDTPPINPSIGGPDAWVAKLNSSGLMQWYTHMGSVDWDNVRSMAVDGDGNVFVAGRSHATWGSPVNPYVEESDAFLAKLNTNGVRQWHTFLGSTGYDEGTGVAIDGSGNVYFSGHGDATWGAPINPYVGEWNAFLAKLNNNGVRQWHTFLGSEGLGLAWGLVIDQSSNIFVGGSFILGGFGGVQLSPDGIIQRHFTIPHGGSGAGKSIAVNTSGNVYFAGGMAWYWWPEPVPPVIVPWTDGGGWDAAVVKFETSVEIDIDIKPGGYPNSINPFSRGEIPVAILTTEDFDAMTVDEDSVMFGPAEAEKRHQRAHVEDVDGDGDLDLLLHFRTQETGIACGDTEAHLTGETFFGQAINGSDSIKTVGCALSCQETANSEYILSGGPDPDAGIYVDDILRVTLNGELITEFWQSGRCCPPADPVRFTADTGDTLRLAAEDANDCYSLESLYLQKADGSCLTQLTEDIFGPNCGAEPPNQIFFDESLVLP